MNREQHNQAFYWSLITLDLLTFVVNLTTSLLFIRFRKRLLVTTHNRILFSMALADALVGVFGFNLGLLLYLKKSSMYYKLAGNIPMFSSLFGSVLALALLTIDRLIAVKKPFIYSSHWYRRVITRLIIVTWLIPLAITVMQSMVFLYLSSRDELFVRSIFFSVFFFLATLILIVFNFFLIMNIRTHFSRVDSSIVPTRSAASFQAVYETEQGQVETTVNFKRNINNASEISRGSLSVAPNDSQIAERNRRVKRLNLRGELKQTSLFCVAIVSLFIVLWCPLAVYRLHYAVGISLNIFWLRRLSLCLTVANSLLNPVFYFLAKRELRGYLAKFLHLSW